jgi:hypothetical protein
MPAPNLTEIYQTLRAAIVGNAGVTSLLSAADAVYQEGSANVRITAPAILLRIITEGRQTQIDAQGKFRPALRITIMAQQTDRCRAIEAAMQSVLDIPRTVATPLTGATLRIESLMQVDANEAGSFPTADQSRTSVLETVWNCSVRAL